MEFVKYEQHGDHVVIITLNRPERLNAWGSQLAQDTEEAFCRFADDPQLRVAILTGAGRAFCAGRDMKEREAHVRLQEYPKYRQVFGNDWGTPELTKPVIGAVHGYCIGAGVNRVLMRCDIRICGESAQFGMPEVARGLMDLSTPFGYQNIPTCFLSELFYTGDFVPASRAYHFGMVNMVVPDDQVMPTALRMAERIAQHSPQAIRNTKKNLMKALEPPQQAFVWENHLRQETLRGPDIREGLAAYREKRPPQWKAV